MPRAISGPYPRRFGLSASPERLEYILAGHILEEIASPIAGFQAGAMATPAIRLAGYGHMGGQASEPYGGLRIPGYALRAPG